MKYKSKKQYIALQKQSKYLQEFNKLFSFEQETYIRKLYIDGLSCNQIAKKYGCSKSPILRIIKDLPKRNPWDYSNHFSKNQGFGENHHSWKGGYKSIYDRIRDLRSYWNWRNRIIGIYKICQNCSSDNNLEVHHKKTLKSLITDYCKQNKISIISLTEKDLNNSFFYDINNGNILCKSCHRIYHKLYGRK